MKICFVCLNIYPLFNSEVKSLVGGAEWQQKYLGEEFLRQGHCVSYLVFDHKQETLEKREGILFHKTFAPKAGWPVVRFFYPRLFSLWLALKKANAEVYYCRCAGWQVGVVAFFCRLYGRKFIYAGAHNSNFFPFSDIPLNLRDRYFYRYGLKQANLIVCQTPIQKKLLAQNYGLEGYIQPNVCPSFFPSEERSPHIILWVSHLHPDKRPQWFLELARALPQYFCVMAGGAKGGQEKLYQEIAKEAQDIPNLNFLGLQPQEKIEELLAQSKVFVNTSLQEGFPNTYLQAWRRGVPVIATFDPGIDMSSLGFGRLIQEKKELLEQVQSVMEDETLFNSSQIKKHFQEIYSPQIAVTKIVDTLGKVRKKS